MGNRNLPDGFSYAHEKVSKAVYLLAVGSGRIQARLLDAAIAFVAVNLDDFPTNLKPEFAYVRDRLTRVAATADEGDIAATLAVMSDDEAVDLAEKLVSLDFELEQLA